MNIFDDKFLKRGFNILRLRKILKIRSCKSDIRVVGLIRSSHQFMVIFVAHSVADQHDRDVRLTFLCSRHVEEPTHLTLYVPTDFKQNNLREYVWHNIINHEIEQKYWRTENILSMKLRGKIMFSDAVAKPPYKIVRSIGDPPILSSNWGDERIIPQNQLLSIKMYMCFRTWLLWSLLQTLWHGNPTVSNYHASQH